MSVPCNSLLSAHPFPLHQIINSFHRENWNKSKGLFLRKVFSNTEAYGRSRSSVISITIRRGKELRESVSDLGNGGRPNSMKLGEDIDLDE